MFVSVGHVKPKCLNLLEKYIMASMLVVVAALVLIILATVLITGAITSRGSGPVSTEPSCGRCGYATRGLSELICPECGADLREVGIRKPGEGRAAFAGCLMPLLTTILIFLLAAGGMALSSTFVPTYEDQSTHFDLWPESEAYSEVLLSTDLILIVPASDRSNVYGFGVTSNSTSPASTTIDFGGGSNAKVKVESIAIEVMSMPKPNPPNTLTYAPMFLVDPATRIATWTDAQGKTQTTKGPVTDKDLLDYFAAYNVDTSQQGVALEAQQLTDMVNGLLDGKNTFTLQGFDSGGYGSGSTGHLGPPWFVGVYLATWIVIWIIAIVVVVRRSRKRNASAMS